MFAVQGWNLPSKVATQEPEKKKRKKDDKTDSEKQNVKETKKKSLRSDSNRDKTESDVSEQRPKSEVNSARKSKSHKNKSDIEEGKLRKDKKSKKSKSEKSPKKSEKDENTAEVLALDLSEKSQQKAMAPRPSKLTPLQQKMKEKLSGARFRWINEQLYTTTSDQAFKLVQESPELFDEYHTGFRSQVKSWPENPVDTFISRFQTRLQAKPINAPGGLPGNAQSRAVTIADMGCGEAELARKLTASSSASSSSKKRSHFVVHSFDLKKANDFITVADIKRVPLKDHSVDVVVFCLALMGTNFLDFINEGLRILRPNGELWIAEIKSRFPDNDISSFVDALKKMGLILKSTDDTNKMFVTFEFFKPTQDISERKKRKFIERDDSDQVPVLKPCLYKRR